MVLVRCFIYIILVFFIIVFSLSNSQIISLKLWPFAVQINIALFLIIFLMLFIGIILTSLVFWLNNIKLKHKIHKQQKLINNLQQQIADRQIVTNGKLIES